MCDRPRCDEPCKKKLRCRHPCVGLCGEPCPKLCRICNKDQLCEIFFGDEDEDDARFIQVDCGHVFEVKGMDRYMDQVPDEENSIKPKSCPRCRRSIHSVLRYGNIIKQNCAEVDVVKRKIACQKQALKEEAQSIRVKLTSHMPRSFIENLGKKREDILHIAKVLLSFHETLKDISGQFQWPLGVNEKERNILFKKYKERIEKIAKRSVISEQEHEEFVAELERFRLIVEFWKMTENDNVIHHEKIQQDKKQQEDPIPELTPFDVQVEIDKMKQIFQSCRVLTPDDTNYIKTILKKSTEISKLPGISEAERKMIVETMNFSKKGHWYKCPKGHIYVIGECGGAMEKSECPECGAVIGGTRHQLTQGNTVASEMDGARHAAWSDAANMENYNLDDMA